MRGFQSTFHEANSLPQQRPFSIRQRKSFIVCGLSGCFLLLLLTILLKRIQTDDTGQGYLTEPAGSKEAQRKKRGEVNLVLKLRADSRTPGPIQKALPYHPNWYLTFKTKQTNSGASDRTTGEGSDGSFYCCLPP